MTAVAVRQLRRSLVVAGLIAVAVTVAVILATGQRPAPAPVRIWGPATPVVSLSSNRQLPVVLEDDEGSLFSTPSQRRAFFATLHALGVSIIRISSDWSVQAPDGAAATPPRHFDGADPNDYAAAKMADLDDAVRAAAAVGIRVDLDIGFYAPLWATRSDGDSHPTAANAYHREVNPAMFAAYAQMLATRYDGHFRPVGQARALPAVSLFEIWNEPNLSWDFAPQTVDGRPVSADLYRGLVDAAYPVIHRVDPAATVLIGNTSSMGAPLAFIEQLACVNTRLVPIHSGSCAHFHTVPADGYAHHPYSYDQPPWTQSTDPEAAPIGDLARLQALLDRLVALRRLAPGAADLWLTEEGYQSNAQLPDSRWNEAQQAQFLAISEYEAWTDRQIVTFSQFLLHDTEVRAALALRKAHGAGAQLPAGTWTTGLEREDGTPKPALAMLRSPVVARPLAASGDCRALEVWGRLQPDATARVTANVEFGAATGGFERVATLATGPDGVLNTVLRYSGPPPARVRIAFTDDGITIISPAADPHALGHQPLPVGIPAKISCA